MSYGTLTQAAKDVLAERLRQVEKEGWTPEHDDQHQEGELAEAAACYAHAASMSSFFAHQQGLPEEERCVDLDEVTPPHQWPPFEGRDDTMDLGWPWEASAWKPGDRRRMLVKAAALILSAIEQEDRQEPISVAPDLSMNPTEGCLLEAVHDGEGWGLQVLYPECHERHGEAVALLAWPESWPKWVDEDFLLKAGFEVN